MAKDCHFRYNVMWRCNVQIFLEDTWWCKYQETFRFLHLVIFPWRRFAQNKKKLLEGNEQFFLNIYKNILHQIKCNSRKCVFVCDINNGNVKKINCMQHFFYIISISNLKKKLNIIWIFIPTQHNNGYHIRALHSVRVSDLYLLYLCTDLLNF